MSKQKKIYKVKNDKHSEYFDHKNPVTHHPVKNISILPHPTTLESYEEISPGITTKLGSLIKCEQEHRHKVDMKKLQFYKFGQILTALLAIVVMYATFIMLDIYNNPYLAACICISGFSFLTVINIFATKTRTKHNHKYFKHKSTPK